MQEPLRTVRITQCRVGVWFNGMTVGRIDSRRNIMLVLVQDGIGYFACTLAITTANLIVLKGLTPALQDCLFIMQGVIQDILCSKVIFHVRAVNDPSVDTLASQMLLSAHMFGNLNASHCDVVDPVDPSAQAVSGAVSNY